MRILGVDAKGQPRVAPELEATPVGPGEWGVEPQQGEWRDPGTMTWGKVLFAFGTALATGLAIGFGLSPP